MKWYEFITVNILVSSFCILTSNTSLLSPFFHFFFFNDTATTEIYTLSLHDALPIFFDTASWSALKTARFFLVPAPVSASGGAPSSPGGAPPIHVLLATL